MHTDDGNGNGSAKLKILLADADGAMMDAVEAALGRDLAVFEKAYDGRQAIEKAERFAPDLIVIEANLPRMSGFMMLQKIRKTAGQKPFVIMTADGCGNRHEQYATITLGADAFFHKPVRMKRLVEKAHTLLGVPAPTDGASTAKQP
jgi:two-component system response regulator MprA